MAAKSKGTSVRKTRGGQFEWTMAKSGKKPGWQLTKSGKLIKRGFFAAHFFMELALKDGNWRKQNLGIFLLALRFVRDQNPDAPGQTMRTPQNAAELLKYKNALVKAQRKMKRFKGQAEFDFGRSDNPF